MSKIKQKIILIFMAVVSLVIIGENGFCSDFAKEMLRKTYFLGCNVHLSSAENWGNASIKFQDGYMLPWGNLVQVERITINRYHGGVKVRFNNLLTGKRHRYILDKEWAEAESAEKHLLRVFLIDSSPVSKQVKAMSDIDQMGIKEGRAIPGMSKEAVLIALGYPPAHLTADPMAADQWKYMRTETESFSVLFDGDGKVR